MKEKPIKIVFANEAKIDLKKIYLQIVEKTKSVQSAINVRTDIIHTIKTIRFSEQYQVDEILGVPYRRMIVRNFKIIYRVQSPIEIRILQIFDSRQSAKKMRRR